MNPGIIYTCELCERLGISRVTLCRWSNEQNARGLAIRRARLHRGCWSVRALVDAGLLVP